MFSGWAVKGGDHQLFLRELKSFHLLKVLDGQIYTPCSVELTIYYYNIDCNLYENDTVLD